MKNQSKKVGYIKLPRWIMDWQWYEDSNVYKLLTHLLLKANFEPKEWQGQKIMPGQLITSFDKLSIYSGLSVSKVRTALKKLESTGDVKLEPTNRFTKITLADYFFYHKQDEQRMNKKSTSNSKQMTTTKELNKNKITLEEFKESVNALTNYSDIIKTKFLDYWTEKNQSTGLMRFQEEKFWETSKRMKKWAENEKSQTNTNETILLNKNRP